MSLNGKKLMTAVKGGASGLQKAYRDMQRAAEERAKRNIAKAKTKHEKEMARINLEREKVAIQLQMYEAQAALAREKEAATKAWRAAGGRTLGERLQEQATQFSHGLQDAQRSIQKAQRGSARKSGTRKTTAKRTAPKRATVAKKR